MNIAMLETLQEALRTVSGVQEAKLWTRVAGKERIYLDLTKHNGGARWNGGKGMTVVYDPSTDKLTYQGEWAGAATRNFHQENGTIAKIRACIKSAF